MGKKIFVPCFYDRLFPEKFTVKDYSSNTKLEQGDHYYIQTLPKVILSFFLQSKTSAPDVFSFCWFIPRAHFKLSSVMAIFYGYEI